VSFVQRSNSAHPDAKPLNSGQYAALFLLSAYKVGISPLLPLCCKFHPSCSVYAMEAIRRHGVLRGVRLAAGRLIRCRPFAPGGVDPVPDA